MRSVAVLALGMALFSAPVRADVVTDWNAASFEVMNAANVAGAPAARALAIVHVAMADAVNSVQNRYTRYAYKGAVQTSASAEAAASSAARSVLLAMFPAQRDKIEAAHAAAVAGVADAAAKDAGMKLGEQAATAVLADRANDDSSVPDTYRPITTPGTWVPTTPPLTAQYARARPWGASTNPIASAPARRRSSRVPCTRATTTRPRTWAVRAARSALQRRPTR